jgi:hypothetical protein
MRFSSAPVNCLPESVGEERISATLHEATALFGPPGASMARRRGNAAESGRLRLA